MSRPRTLVAVGDGSPLGRAVLRHAFDRFDVQAVLFPTEQTLDRFRRPPERRSRWQAMRASLSQLRTGPPRQEEPLADRGMGERLPWDQIAARWRPGSFDLLLSAGFPAIFPDRVLAVADRRVNVHTSLLPQLKGRNPHYWAVEWGLERSGLTVHEMTQEVDAGAVVAQCVVEIPPGTDYAQHYRDLRAAVPDVLDQVMRWVSTGERATPVEVEESWSPGEPAG